MDARAILAGVLALGLLGSAARADVPPTAVDLALALAVDVSGSIDPDEAALQRQGYVSAFSDPTVVGVIRTGQHGRIAVAYYEWASNLDFRLVVDWTVIDGADAARAFADQLAAQPIRIGLRTSISGAIEYGVQLIERAPVTATRRVIDISGDGPNNDGRYVLDARQAALDKGISINGLPVLNERPNRYGFPNLPDLDLYYEGCVIGGPNAFIVVAKSFPDFAVAVKRKLVLEIADLPAPKPERRRYAAVASERYAPGCDVGERQSRDFWRRRALD
jgi:hypothetical protein